MRRYLEAARITGKKNLDGRLVAKAADGLPFLLVEGMEVHLVPPVVDAPRRARVTEVRPIGDGVANVWLDAVSDAATAEALVGCRCLVARDELPDTAETIAADALAGRLDGWRFVDEESGRAGVVVRVGESVGQLLMEVELDDESGKTHLVPYVSEMIVSEDESEGVLTMRVPKGLFDL